MLHSIVPQKHQIHDVEAKIKQIRRICQIPGLLEKRYAKIFIVGWRASRIRERERRTQNDEHSCNDEFSPQSRCLVSHKTSVIRICGTSMAHTSKYGHLPVRQNPPPGFLAPVVCGAARTTYRWGRPPTIRPSYPLPPGLTGVSGSRQLPRWRRWRCGSTATSHNRHNRPRIHRPHIPRRHIPRPHVPHPRIREERSLRYCSCCGRGVHRESCGRVSRRSA